MENNVTEEMAKQVGHYIWETLEELEQQILFFPTGEGRVRKRLFYDRLQEVDLWDTESIIEEYIKIKDKESKLPAELRRAVEMIFEAGVLKYKAAKEQKPNEDEV